MDELELPHIFTSFVVVLSVMLEFSATQSNRQDSVDDSRADFMTDLSGKVLLAQVLKFNTGSE
jgi:hypothetical protein